MGGVMKKFILGSVALAAMISGSAMAAGGTNKPWEMSDMVKVLEDWEANRVEKR